MFKCQRRHVNSLGSPVSTFKVKNVHHTERKNGDLQTLAMKAEKR